MTLQMYRMLKCHTSAKCRHLFWARAGFTLIALIFAAFICLLGSKAAKGSEQVNTSVVLLSLETDGQTIDLTFDRPVDISIAHLDGPPRIVIDLPETNFAALDQNVRLPELVSAIRYGLMSPGQSRIVLTLSTTAIGQFLAASNTGITQQIELVLVDQVDFATRVNNDSVLQNPSTAPKLDRLGQVAGETGQGPFTLVIDPGHGGIDGGAEGKLGTREKDVTLAFGLALRDALKNTPDVRVIMTRETDVFVGLNERVKIARQNAAELFLSIHGDSIKAPEVRGATLYTLSDSASDAISSALANQENLSDAIAGLPPMQPDPDMNSILVDLLKQETATFSRELATQIVVYLKENSIELINNPVRSAGFSVLTAPDVPSLLLEMGYLSNHEDELLLRDPNWRRQTASVIAKAVAAYAKGHRTRSAK